MGKIGIKMIALIHGRENNRFRTTFPRPGEKLNTFKDGSHRPSKSPVSYRMKTIEGYMDASRDNTEVVLLNENLGAVMKVAKIAIVVLRVTRMPIAKYRTLPKTLMSSENGTFPLVDAFCSDPGISLLPGFALTLTRP
jgi:hypothetical protein